MKETFLKLVDRTVLGEYLRTREIRLLWAFFLYTSIFFILIAISLSVISNASGAISDGNMNEYYRKLLFLITALSIAFVVASFCAKRHSVALKSCLISIFLALLCYLKP